MTQRHFRTSDQREQDLRDLWHQRKEEWVADGCPSSSPSRRAFDHADSALASYLWNRAKAEIEEDRRRHPKARRNLPVGAEGSAPTRHLP